MLFLVKQSRFVLFVIGFSSVLSLNRKKVHRFSTRSTLLVDLFFRLIKVAMVRLLLHNTITFQRYIKNYFSRFCAFDDTSFKYSFVLRNKCNFNNLLTESEGSETSHEKGAKTSLTRDAKKRRDRGVKKKREGAKIRLSLANHDSFVSLNQVDI